MQEQFQTYQSVHENEAITQQQSTLEQTTKSKGDDSQIDSHHQKETQRIQSALKTHEAQLLQYRGNVRSSTLLYREKQSGLPTLMNNALLGGAFYQSPQEYERKLHEQSQNSSAQRLALESIGSQKDDLSIEDFEKTFQSNLHSRGISDDADSGLANNRVHSSDETQTTQSDKVKVQR